jgi:hypothetical protein
MHMGSVHMYMCSRQHAACSNRLMAVVRCRRGRSAAAQGIWSPPPPPSQLSPMVQPPQSASRNASGPPPVPPAAAPKRHLQEGLGSSRSSRAHSRVSDQPISLAAESSELGAYARAQQTTTDRAFSNRPRGLPRGVGKGFQPPSTPRAANWHRSANGYGVYGRPQLHTQPLQRRVITARSTTFRGPGGFRAERLQWRSAPASRGAVSSQCHGLNASAFAWPQGLRETPQTAQAPRGSRMAMPPLIFGHVHARPSPRWRVRTLLRADGGVSRM